MPRRKRSYLPGCAFHVTARTHCGEFWFEELRNEIVALVALALTRSDALLLAYAIMTNHFHLIVRQGIEPLGRLLQPLNQRVAYAVHRHNKRKGYVLGYRYFDTPCANAAHLRNAIMYTHRNPVEAGMCQDACDYQWSSALAYRTGSSAASGIAALQPAVDLFASGLPDRTRQQDYADFYAWYHACKQLGPDEPRPHSPGVTADDVFWMQNAGAALATDRARPDLRDVVLRALASSTPAITIADLCVSTQTRRHLAIRDAVILSALRAGHRRVDVARFLKTSDSTVSRVGASLVKAPSS